MVSHEWLVTENVGKNEVEIHQLAHNGINLNRCPKRQCCHCDRGARGIRGLKVPDIHFVHRGVGLHVGEVDANAQDVTEILAGSFEHGREVAQDLLRLGGDVAIYERATCWVPRRLRRDGPASSSRRACGRAAVVRRKT